MISYAIVTIMTLGCAIILSACATTPPDSAPATGSHGLKYTINADGTTCTISGIEAYTNTEIDIPTMIDGYSVTGIGSQAFQYHSELTSITIPPSVKIIGDGAFSYCRSLVIFTIPDSVTSIGTTALGNCNSLESITLPFVGARKNGTGDTNFGYIFGQTLGNSHTGQIPTSLTTVVITGGQSIDARAFENCKNLTSVALPGSITSIGSSAFYNCIGLSIITIPDSVTSIGNNAFDGCKGLTSITIGRGVKSIGGHALRECSGLKNITYVGSIFEWQRIQKDESWAEGFWFPYVNCANGLTFT